MSDLRAAAVAHAGVDPRKRRTMGGMHMNDRTVVGGLDGRRIRPLHYQRDLLLNVGASRLRRSHSNTLPGWLVPPGGTSLNCSTKSGRRSGCGTTAYGRRSVGRLDQAVDPVPWQAPSSGAGRGRDHAVSLGVRGSRAGSASTQNQALCALVFLHRHVLGQNLGWLEDGPHQAVATAPAPVDETRGQNAARRDRGRGCIMTSLLYGAGLCLLECLGLRVKDRDFASHQILVCVGKGHKDRRTILPVVVKEPLVAHLEHVYQQHQHDLAHGFRRVYVPDALQRKYLSTIIEKGPFSMTEKSPTPRMTGCLA